jgi:type IV pilus assembly protein PilC
MQFRCRVASPSGEISEGVFSADSESRLRHDFEEKGLFVLSLQPKGAIGGMSLRLPQRASIPMREFLVFNQELATLLKAGMPLVQSLDLLKRRVDSPVLRGVLDDVHSRVRSGSALSEAFSAHESVVPSVYTASLLAGERSGSLDTVLRRYVEYSKVVATVKRKALSALIYPAILTTLSLGVVAVIVLYVVPAFADFFASFGSADNPVQLPVLTRGIMAVSLFVVDRFVLILVAALAAFVGFATWVRQPGQRARFDRLLLSLPMAGDVARKFSTSQMARTLATLLGGGLPLVNALAIATRSMSNQYLAGQLGIVSERVREGESFATALDARKAFPEVVVKMAEVGEQTGALQEMLNTVADFFDEEIATNMERFLAIIEPTILVTMGIVIATLVIAIYLPLFQLSSVLTQPGR